MNAFTSILERHPETDKHNGFYEQAYEQSFKDCRERIKTVFEIGVYRGGGVRVFRDYFPNAQIVGIDVDYAANVAEDRIVTEIGNATDARFLASVIDRHGRPDIVIDDGSHYGSEIRAAFDVLYPLTNFCYVIEDLDTQYSKNHDGRFVADGFSYSTVLQGILHDILCNKTQGSMRVYHAICFLFKVGF